MTNAKVMHQTFIKQEGSLIHCLALGLFLNGNWTLQVLSLKRQGIRDTCWLAQITLPNGLKLNLWQILEMQMLRNLWKKIVTRFGIPRTLILNNGSQFDSKAFRRYYYDMGITNKYSSSVYPQGNGQAEAVNKVIVSGLKKRLDDAKRKWAEEMPHVLWTYQTTPRRSIGQTPFSMTYGAEAVIPLKLGSHTKNKFFHAKQQ